MPIEIVVLDRIGAIAVEVVHEIIHQKDTNYAERIIDTEKLHTPVGSGVNEMPNG